MSDGIEIQSCCNGTVHVDLVRTMWEERRKPASVNVQRPCDASCQLHRIDMRKLIEEMRTERLITCPVTKSSRSDMTAHGVIKSNVHIDGTLRTLLRSAEPLMGKKLASSYGKRGGQSMNVCLGAIHVEIRTRFDWYSGEYSDSYQTHRLRSSPCDGSCRPEAVMLTDRQRKDLRDQTAKLAARGY